jgi:hypothetical protein
LWWLGRNTCDIFYLSVTNLKAGDSAVIRLRDDKKDDSQVIQTVSALEPIHDATPQQVT